MSEETVAQEVDVTLGYNISPLRLVIVKRFFLIRALLRKETFNIFIE